MMWNRLASAGAAGKAGRRAFLTQAFVLGAARVSRGGEDRFRDHTLTLIQCPRTEYHPERRYVWRARGAWVNQYGDTRLELMSLIDEECWRRKAAGG